MSLFRVESGKVIIDAPARLTIRSYKPKEEPVIEGATVWASHRINDHHLWFGCCSSNGGNAWHRPGNPITMQVHPDGVYHLVATHPSTGKDEDIWIGMAAGTEPAISPKGLKSILDARS